MSKFCNHISPSCHHCDCHCDLDDLSLGGINLGSQPVTSTDLEFQTNQALGIHNEPDIRLTHEEQSACCSSEETCHESCNKGCKYRHFQIKGDICVSEKVTFRENGIEESESEGCACKNTVSVDSTDSGLSLGDGQECYCAEAETPLEVHPCDGDLSAPPPIPCTTTANCPSFMFCPLGGGPAKTCQVGFGPEPEC